MIRTDLMFITVAISDGRPVRVEVQYRILNTDGKGDVSHLTIPVIGEGKRMVGLSPGPALEALQKAVSETHALLDRDLGIRVSTGDIDSDEESDVFDEDEEEL
jgi:hypothetical protein